MNADPDATCEVALLVPQDPGGGSILCEASTDGLTLPTVRVAPEPATASIIEAVDSRLGVATTPLRVNSERWAENWDAVAIVVEVEPLSDVPADRIRWARIEDADLPRVHPEWVRPTVAGWLAERADGWSALRPQWSRPGWLAEASAWMLDQMRRAGFGDPQTPSIHYLWGLTAVVVADSLDGRAFLKASSDRFRREGVVTQALAKESPGVLPDVLAVEPDRGWMLMRDFGSADLGDKRPETWGSGLDALRSLQQTWLGRGEELIAAGAELRPLEVLTAWVLATKEDDELMRQLDEGERRDWLRDLHRYADACERLAVIGPGPTLVHGDFHPWNVALQSERACVYDWTDACVSHAYLDLVTYVMRTPDVGVRSALLRDHLAGWRGYVPASDERELVELCLVVGALFQAHTYSQLIPTVMPEDLSQLRGGDAEWVQRAMRFREQGLAAVY